MLEEQDMGEHIHSCQYQAIHFCWVHPERHQCQQHQHCSNQYMHYIDTVRYSRCSHLRPRPKGAVEPEKKSMFVMCYVLLDRHSHARPDSRVDRTPTYIYFTAQINGSSLTRKEKTLIYLKADYSPTAGMTTVEEYPPGCLCNVNSNDTQLNVSFGQQSYFETLL